MEGIDETELRIVVLPLLKPTAPQSGKHFALDNFLPFTATAEGQTFFKERPEFLAGISSLRKDSDATVKSLALKCLINLTGNPELSRCFVKDQPGFARELAMAAIDPKEEMADEFCGVLANLTRTMDCATAVAKHLLEEREGQSRTVVEDMVLALCRLGHNPNCDLHKLALCLQNLTQVHSVRAVLMDDSKCLLPRLLCFTTFQDSAVRRGGVVGLLKNCTFDYDRHGWLLGEKVDILPYLLLPLAGGETLDDDENEGLPPELQYLDEDKEREPMPEIRRDLIEALTKLTGTKAGLDFLIEKKTYYILRELHKWEKDPETMHQLEILVNTLISDRVVGMENLAEVEIPAEKEEFIAKDLEEDRALVRDSLREAEEEQQQQQQEEEKQQQQQEQQQS